MTIGLSASTMRSTINSWASGISRMSSSDADRIAFGVSKVIEDNNKQLEKDIKKLLARDV